MSVFLWMTLLSFGQAEPISLSPADWGAERLTELQKKDAFGWENNELTEGKKAMVMTTSFAGTAPYAGYQALKMGGTAMDAALATAFTQITLHLGSWSSFAGIMSLVYYEAETGKIYSLEGGWQIPLAETDPMSIPVPGKFAGNDGDAKGEVSGRGMLVPGFMSVAEASHKKFGKLPWGKLFEPSIYFSEKGMKWRGLHFYMTKNREEILKRFPDGWAQFRKPDGSAYEVGDNYTRPVLAKTLKAVAEQGAGYMYEGPWGQKLVKRVQEIGGNLTMEDLKRYKPNWTNVLHTNFGDYSIHAPDFPNMGGIHAVEAFRLLEHAEITGNGPYWQDAQKLYQMIHISRMAAILTLAPQRYGFDAQALFGDYDFSPKGRVNPETTAAMWRRMSQPDWGKAIAEALYKPPMAGNHSDSVVAVDAYGNVVALTHSINSLPWGATGLFVDGIAISDGPRSQRPSMAKAGAGNRLPEATNPMIVLHKGKPVIASGAVGRGLHEVSMQCLVNIMDLDMDPKAAVDAPKIIGPQYNPVSKKADTYHIQRMVDKGFDPKVLDELRAMGQELYMQKPEDQKAIGYWIGIKIDRKKGVIQASGTAIGGAKGY